jgi:hypothetical protein
MTKRCELRKVWVGPDVADRDMRWAFEWNCDGQCDADERCPSVWREPTVSYGAVARGEALAAGHPDWMHVTQWPLPPEPEVAQDPLPWVSWGVRYPADLGPTRYEPRSQEDLRARSADQVLRDHERAEKLRQRASQGS